jgi:disulfide oxidoreductase YuzD
MTEYYSDNEIVERIKNVGNSKDSYEWLANLVEQRFLQKDRQISFQASRLRTAAEHIGFTMIDELQSYE